MAEAAVVIDKLKESGIWIEGHTLLEVNTSFTYLLKLKLNNYFISGKYLISAL